MDNQGFGEAVAKIAAASDNHVDREKLVAEFFKLSAGDQRSTLLLTMLEVLVQVTRISALERRIQAVIVSAVLGWGVMGYTLCTIAGQDPTTVLAGAILGGVISGGGFLAITKLIK